MLVLNADRIRALVTFPRLIDSVREAFRGECVVPPRQVVLIPGGTGERRFLSMSAFAAEGGAVAKLATVFPENAARGLPTIQAAIVMFSETGTPVALLNGTLVTQLRTGAASALASTYLSREDSSHLVLIGTGALAPMMAAAHCTVRPITRITVCGRRPERTAATADAIRSLVDDRIETRIAGSIDAAVTTADIVSCATSSPQPLINGKCLRGGTFVDVVGSFSPSRRETDDDVVRRARIFVDTFEGAFAEAGDILDPLARCVIERTRIEGELADLVRGKVRGRLNASEITMFKSVGTAIEDLATARLLVELAQGGLTPTLQPAARQP